MSWIVRGVLLLIALFLTVTAFRARRNARRAGLPTPPGFSTLCAVASLCSLASMLV